jgi:oligo-1,6-glucosidase/alpha-glucosidase
MTDMHWCQKTSIYQIYPRSFKDSNGDGIGDLKGIISKLDYIRDLGFETIWLSPFFQSPQGDWGYDVSDYLNISPEYGQLSDVERLINEVHRRDMHILFDFVLNHTSDQHPWFLESRSSRHNPKRDWYIWRDGHGSRPPNNWKSQTGNSGWNFDPATDQWYYTSFLTFQPDLNFRNPDVKNTMLDIARYWLDKGVDGFRLDIFHCLFKDKYFRDNPWSYHLLPHNDKAGFFQEWKFNLMRHLIDSYSPGRMLLGELFGNDDVMKEYLGKQQDGLNLVFSWDLMDLKISAPYFRSLIQRYEAEFPAPYTPVPVLGNHDRKRLLSRINENIQIAKLLALFQLTIRGVPVVYYGEEIGMSDVYIPGKKAKDPVGIQYKWVPEFILEKFNLFVNRDRCRTPMQWKNEENAGYCKPEVQSWLPVHRNYTQINVASEKNDNESLFNVYKKLLKLRRESQAIQEGAISLVDSQSWDEQLLAFKRQSEKETILVLINFSDAECTFHNTTECKQVVFQIGYNHVDNEGEFRINPWSGMVLSS